MGYILNFTKWFKHNTNKLGFLAVIFVLFCSHNLYLKMNTYFVKPNVKTTLSLYNGTFNKSENIITRNRILEASIIGHGKRKAINAEQWTDLDSTITQLNFTTGKTGTYVAGVSTKAMNISLTADKFNSYLKHDGVLDMLAYRTKNKLLNQDAVESYEKHVKAIFQVGDKKTEDWKTVLGYPIEFVPLENPYTTYTGDTLKVKLLLSGKPLANQLVYADYITSSHNHDHHSHSHSHEHNTSHNHHHTHTTGQKLRTNNKGIVDVLLPKDGIYYLRTINMVNVNDSDTLTHQSKWATLTFEITHKHDDNSHEHHHHEHKTNIPTWVFILGSLAIIGVLFLIFRHKN